LPVQQVPFPPRHISFGINPHVEESSLFEFFASMEENMQLRKELPVQNARNDRPVHFRIFSWHESGCLSGE
jgi:hypothetical protein